MKSILIVDDDQMLREMLGELLTENGFAVTEAGDSSTALAKAKAGKFDAITVDLVLGEEDGMNLVSEIRPLQPAAKIYVLTGMEEDHTDEAAKHGADGFLFKHTAIDELVGILN